MILSLRLPPPPDNSSSHNPQKPSYFSKQPNFLPKSSKPISFLIVPKVSKLSYLRTEATISYIRKKNIPINFQPRGRMSVTISNWKQICDAPTNRSLSKMTFSFSKATRFHTEKENKSQIFYDIEAKASRRTTSFGYGNKYDFTRDQPKSPPPNSYSIPTSFSPDAKKTKGYCFGEGRDEMTITGPLAETINNKNPGPGAYEPIKKTGKIAFSLRGKIKPPQPEAQKVPGPGTYKENNYFNKDGTVFLSKHTNHKAIKFNSGGDRFKKLNSPNPGPGKYDTSTVDLSPYGKYTLSNLQNSKVRSFGHSVRKTFANRCKTPGPGNYTLPSEFGYYLDRKQYLNTQTSKLSVSHEAP